jgi:hypothetical protein
VDFVEPSQGSKATITPRVRPDWFWRSGHPRQRLQMDGTADNRADRTIQESRIADLKTITRSQAASILEPTPCARPTRLRLHARQDNASRRPTLLTVAAQAAAASAPLTTKWS